MTGEGTAARNGSGAKGAAEGERDARAEDARAGIFERRSLIAGAIALACFAIHGAVHASRGELYEMLWCCNAATGVIAIAGFLQWRDGHAMALLWLAAGIQFWIADLATGGELMPTSILTHLVSPIAAVWALGAVGWPRGAWWRGAIGLGLVVLATRFLSPAKANVNLAHAVWPPLAKIFPSHAIYVVFMVGVCGGFFWLVERIVRWRTSRSLAREAG